MIIKRTQIVPLLVIIACFALVIRIIWLEEFQHYLPVKQQEQGLNQSVQLSFASQHADRPSYIHFFSDDCLNARINMDHISRMTDDFKDDFNFYIINKSTLSAHELKRKYNLPSYYQIIEDEKGVIMRSLNILTVPHSLIVNVDNTLYFSGNYMNQNGLCGPMDIKWSAPAIALKFLSKENNPPLFPSYQRNFRGCQIN